MTTKDPATHPCFSMDAAHRFARLHLPVAPKCNVRCAYCNRKFDCVNESRPGVTSAVLSPGGALERFRRMKERFPNLSVVGIAGPGDALANPAQTFETLRLIRADDPEITFCLSTNGVALPEWIDTMRSVGLNHVTVTVNTRRLDVARTLYAWADDGEVRLEGIPAAEFVMARQKDALDALKETGIRVKVNTVYIPGVNDAEIEGIVRFVKERGVDIVNIMPFIPTPGTSFENFPMVSRETLAKVRERMAALLPQMRHCRQCRADAVGNVLDERPVFVENGSVRDLSACVRADRGEGPATGEVLRFAVASGNGYLVDLHFGHASELLVYDASDSSIRFVERRTVGKYCAGQDECEIHGGASAASGMDGARAAERPGERMERVLSRISDCHAVLALRIGDEPRRRLAEKGIHAAMTCDRIDAAIRENRALLAGRTARS